MAWDDGNHGVNVKTAVVSCICAIKCELNTVGLFQSLFLPTKLNSPCVLFRAKQFSQVLWQEG